MSCIFYKFPVLVWEFLRQLSSRNFFYIPIGFWMEKVKFHVIQLWRHQLIKNTKQLNCRLFNPVSIGTSCVKKSPRNTKVNWLLTYLLFKTRNCFLLCVIGHCLHHLLPSERDTGHDLRQRGHSYQLVCYNFSSTRRCFVIRMLYDSLWTSASVRSASVRC